MRIVLKNILAVVAGLVVGSIVNMGLVTIAPFIISPPEGVDVTSTESIAASIHLYGPEQFIFPFLAHALGTLVGACVAYWLAATRPEVRAWIIGILFLVGGVSVIFVIPAPTWFIALDLIVAYLPMAWLGIRLGRRLRNPAVTEANGLE